VSSDFASAKLTGHFIIKKQPFMKLKFELFFDFVNSNILKYNFSVPDIDNQYTNFLQLNFESDFDEEIYGMGLQNSIWNFKGHSVPLVSSEGGVGRGLEPISSIKGIEAGSKTTSYGPALSYITNKNRAFVCE
jgi:hypothetical protein